MHHGKVTKDIAKGLLVLKERIDAAKIPPSKLDESINLATWNVRDFGKTKRSQAAIHYIAEIIGQFDLVGLVELRDNLGDLGRVLKILGPYWRAVYSDMIPDRGGNRERVAYIYDRRAVTFNGLAAEANEPRKKRGLEYLSETSFWRAPYMASFKSGTFDFVVLTTHIRWGTVEGREGELHRLADWVEGKRRSKETEDKDIIVMGDFNIPNVGDPLYNAMTKHGLEMPRALAKLTHGSNLAKNKRYDQILHYSQYPDGFCDVGGAVDFFVDDAHIKKLFPGQKLTRTQFTYQVSDHLPLWVQLRTDFSEFKLEQIIQG